MGNNNTKQNEENRQIRILTQTISQSFHKINEIQKETKLLKDEIELLKKKIFLLEEKEGKPQLNAKTKKYSFFKK